MISIEDSHYTYEYADYFKILPQINNWDKDKNRIKDGSRVKEGFTYSSDNNSEWMTNTELQSWIDKKNWF
jgi:UDP-N-acetylglucosamine 4,6-dehydratase|tara:strand:- start:437 stop:646 length:210 start_codon:yes stop_codon:yes gene_type:complete